MLLRFLPILLLVAALIFSGLTPKMHPTQKSIHVLKNLIEIFTDPGDVVIDPVAGSGTTLIAAEMLGRKSYGFEIKKEYIKAFNEVLAPLAAPINSVTSEVMPSLWEGTAKLG